MRSRATSTEPNWREWVVGDLARYWYIFGVLAGLVFGVGELARVWSPLSPLAYVALFSLAFGVVFVGTAGYVYVWRRDSPGGQWVVRRLEDLHWMGRAIAHALRGEPEAADPPTVPPEERRDPEDPEHQDPGTDPVERDRGRLPDGRDRDP